MLEAVLAVAVGSTVLAGAGQQARVACATLREARQAAAATTVARNVMDAALAAPCAPPETALARCAPSLHCALSTREISRRVGGEGVIVVAHFEVTVQASLLDEHALVRIAGASARPQGCA
jgi:hypothetical protein